MNRKSILGARKYKGNEHNIIKYLTKGWTVEYIK